jgi:prepilin-type N-terminal cleavage/methylation domain-containing protein
MLVMKTKNEGFTLVELLVVITIIAVMVAIGVVIYSQAQKTARKARRIADLKSIQKAVETYYSQNGAYPKTSDTTPSVFSECTAAWATTKSNDAVVPGLVPSFMPALPRDPQMRSSTGKSCYGYISDGKEYKIMDREIEEFSAEDYLSKSEYVDPALDGGSDITLIDGANPKAWAIYSEGGAGL